MNKRRLMQNGVIEGRPLLTALRWALWAGHCLFRIPAIIKIAAIDRKIYLLPRATQFGSTSIFVKREHYEPELLAIRHFVTPASVAIDIGGSFGIYTLCLSKFVGPQGKVITFEPGNLSFEILNKNVGLNRLDNVELHKTALSDEPGSMPLYHIAGSPVNFSLGGTQGVGSEMVSVERLDDVISADDRSRLGFIKIDVEGYEAFALRGGLETIRESKPVIMFEVSHGAINRAGLVPTAPYDVLESLGYRFFRLVSGDVFEPCVAPAQGNIFAVHGEHVARYPVLTGVSKPVRAAG